MKIYFFVGLTIQQKKKKKSRLELKLLAHIPYQSDTHIQPTDSIIFNTGYD